MVRTSSRIKRISNELADEIRRIAMKNHLSYIEASRKLAKVSKKNRNKKMRIEDEIEF